MTATEATGGLIYFDHAGTAPMRRPVLEAMWPHLTSEFGNPSSQHAVGRAAAEALEAARRRVAGVFGCRPAEIVFTGSGTESVNLAITGATLARPRRRHVVTTAVEHKAGLESVDSLVRHHGFEATIVPVDADGLVDVDTVATALRDDTALCSVMYANNEVGTVQPVVEIAAACRRHGVPFHTDAVQAPGVLPLSVADLGVGLLSISAHKFGGPKGVGALFCRRGIPLEPLVGGGGQERGRRSGTENVAAAVGLATALELAEQGRSDEAPRLLALRERLIDGVLGAVPGARLTGHRQRRLPHHASFCFDGVNGESVLLELEMAGVCCSSGSACAAGSTDPSHVLTAMGLSADVARTAVRFTLGAMNTDAEVDQVVALVPDAVSRIGGLGAIARR